MSKFAPEVFFEGKRPSIDYSYSYHLMFPIQSSVLINIANLFWVIFASFLSASWLMRSLWVWSAGSKSGNEELPPRPDANFCTENSESAVNAKPNLTFFLDANPPKHSPEPFQHDRDKKCLQRNHRNVNLIFSFVPHHSLSIYDFHQLLRFLPLDLYPSFAPNPARVLSPRRSQMLTEDFPWCRACLSVAAVRNDLRTIAMISEVRLRRCGRGPRMEI